MVSAHQQKHSQHHSGGPFKCNPSDPYAPDVWQGERLPQWPLGVTVHVGMEDVVEGSVL